LHCDNLITETTSHLQRKHTWDAGHDTVFDVAIIGGGIKGAHIYHQLCEAGYRTVLFEKDDFASGTSQASCMMIWGGLLYLANWDIPTVWKLSSARNVLLRSMPNCIRKQTFRYYPQHMSPLKRRLFQAVFRGYGLFGPNPWNRAASSRPLTHPQSSPSDRTPLPLTFDEAMVGPSDARFVLQLILRHQNSGHIPLNYCEVERGQFDHGHRVWNLQLHDKIHHIRAEWKARCVINVAGTATDSLNRLFGIESPYTHILSKGVSLVLTRNPRHQAPAIYDSEGTVMSYLPWGPVSIWGPTETLIQDPAQGWAVRSDEIQFLLRELRRNLPYPVSSQDIVNTRCGVRTLVSHSAISPNQLSHKLSRRAHVHMDSVRPWITLYGGTFTSAMLMATHVRRTLRKQSIWPSASRRSLSQPFTAPLEHHCFPGLTEPVCSPRWCANYEMCWTLDDYLRRRTNIGQWVPRGGLGRDDEYMPDIKRIADALHADNPAQAMEDIDAYRAHVVTNFDHLSLADHEYGNDAIPMDWSVTPS
jgi:glycerol-3-phosphate dehydrogenase